MKCLVSILIGNPRNETQVKVGRKAYVQLLCRMKLWRFFRGNKVYRGKNTWKLKRCSETSGCQWAGVGNLRLSLLRSHVLYSGALPCKQLYAVL